MDWTVLLGYALGGFGGSFAGAVLVTAAFKIIELWVAMQHHHELTRAMEVAHAAMMEQIDTLVASRMLDRRHERSQ